MDGIPTDEEMLAASRAYVRWFNDDYISKTTALEDAIIAAFKVRIAGHQVYHDDVDRLSKDIGVIIHGDKAPEHPSLCDMVAEVRLLQGKLDKARDVMREVKEDLLRRGEPEPHCGKDVYISSTVWYLLNEAIDES